MRSAGGVPSGAWAMGRVAEALATAGDAAADTIDNPYTGGWA